MTPLLETRRLTYRYPHAATPAVSDVSFMLEQGSLTALLGANGAGKTTLLHLLLGMQPELNDQIWLGGHPLSDLSRREISRWLGFVPQSEHLPFDYSVLEYVLLGRAPHLAPLAVPGAEDVLTAEAALAEVGITALSNRPIPELSGGELQLVMIARALAQQPKIILLDEPTAHLDLANKARLMSLLKHLTERGITILASLHDPETAAGSASHIMLMRHGSMLASGPTAETLTAHNLSETYGVPVAVQHIQGQWLIRVIGEDK
jgi:iron complex transport system ATP-binding protein